MSRVKMGESRRRELLKQTEARLNSDPWETFVFSKVACWPTASSPGRYLPPHFSATQPHLVLLPESHMWTHTLTHTRTCEHRHEQSNPVAQPPPCFSRIWPLVSGCLWAIVCGVDDHCHRLIPLPIVLWWMWPTLTSTDTGVLDHWGRHN